MAKKKKSAASGAARAEKKGAAGQPQKRASSNAAAAGRRKATTAAGTQPTSLSNELIGEAAGRVWQSLSDQGPLTLAALKKSSQGTDELVLLAVGWLAREDKLAFETRGRSTTVGLR